MKLCPMILLVGVAMTAQAQLGRQPGPHSYILPAPPNVYGPASTTNSLNSSEITVTNLPPMRDWVVAGRLYPNVNTNSVKLSARTGKISFQYGAGTSHGIISASINELPPPIAEAVAKQFPYKKPGAK